MCICTCDENEEVRLLVNIARRGHIKWRRLADDAVFYDAVDQLMKMGMSVPELNKMLPMATRDELETIYNGLPLTPGFTIRESEYKRIANPSGIADKWHDSILSQWQDQWTDYHPPSSNANSNRIRFSSLNSTH